jgi:hypothetical protein
MNRRNIATAILCVLVVAGLAWLFHTPAPPVEQVAGASKVTGANVAAPRLAPTGIAPPTAPPAPKPGAAPAGAMAAGGPSSADPQVELNSAIDDIVSLLQAGDLYTAMMRYLPPDQLAQIPDAEKANMQDQIQNQMSQPGAQQGIQMFIQVFQSMKSSAPTMNAAGDKATYQVSDPTGQSPDTVPMSFEKIDGKWYFNTDSMRGR